MQTSYTTEQLAEKLIRDIQEMTPDEKAHLRAKIKRAFSLNAEPKISYKM